MPFLVLIFFTFSLLQQQTGLQVVVLDNANQPLAAISLDLLDEAGNQYQLQTDEQGKAVLNAISGETIFIVRAYAPSGEAIRIEQITLDEGLRLGLLPNATRTVLVRVNEGLLYLDPETLFAGADTPPTVATMQALSPVRDRAEQAPSLETTEQTEQTAPELNPPNEAIATEQSQEDNLSLIVFGMFVAVAGLGAFAIWYASRKRGLQ